jgi:hypothetical protein
MTETAEHQALNVLLTHAQLVWDSALMELAPFQAVVLQSLAHQTLLSNATIRLVVKTQLIAQPPLLALPAHQSSALTALASKTECSVQPLPSATHPHQWDALTWLVLLLLLPAQPLLFAHKAPLLAEMVLACQTQPNVHQSLAHHTLASCALTVSVLLIAAPAP